MAVQDQHTWSISAIGRMRSGTPFTVTTGQDTNVDGTNNDRADLVGNPKLDANRDTDTRREVARGALYDAQMHDGRGL